MTRPAYNQPPKFFLHAGDAQIASFVSAEEINLDRETVRGFGEEWKKFDSFSAEELKVAGEEYFDIVTSEMVNAETVVLDLGCGSGRWSLYIADRVACIESIDPSDSVYAAASTLSKKKNVRVTQAGAGNIPFPDESFDFILCLGVLHHIPDTARALHGATQKLKPGGHALLYFYYALENRSWIYRQIFRVVDLFRKGISKLPKALKHFCCDAIALLIYLPIVFLGKILKAARSDYYNKLPLSYYVNKSFHVMRNDALDRFGTRLEKRFTKKRIEEMMQSAGFEHINFSGKQPYWHVTGKKI